MIDKRPATIGRRTRFRADDFTLLLAALSALGVVLVLARQIVYGAGLASDALEYLAIAGNVLAGEGLTYLSGAPATLWPPLYPLLLAGWPALRWASSPRSTSPVPSTPSSSGSPYSPWATTCGNA